MAQAIPHPEAPHLKSARLFLCISQAGQESRTSETNKMVTSGEAGVVAGALLRTTLISSSSSSSLSIVVVVFVVLAFVLIVAVVVVAGVVTAMRCSRRRAWPVALMLYCMQAPEEMRGALREPDVSGLLEAGGDCSSSVRCPRECVCMSVGCMHRSAYFCGVITNVDVL